MEPVTLILVSLGAGAAIAGSEAVKLGVKDAYNAFKERVLNRSKCKEALKNALAQLEARPDSDARLAVVKEELDPELAQDRELLAQAQQLYDLLRREGQLAARYQIYQTGDGAVAQGPGAKAVGKRGVLIEGDVSGAIIQTGDQRD